MTTSRQVSVASERVSAASGQVSAVVSGAPLTVAHTADSNTDSSRDTAVTRQSAQAISPLASNHAAPTLLVHSNIRAPRGIPLPQRAIPPTDDTQSPATSSDSNNADVICDTNPLRRLRNVNTFRPVTSSVTQRYK